MSEGSLNLLKENPEDVFVGGTFFSALKTWYQLVVMRTFIKKLECFDTLVYILMTHKSFGGCASAFSKIPKRNKEMYTKDLINNKIHTYFEKVLIKSLLC